MADVLATAWRPLNPRPCHCDPRESRGSNPDLPREGAKPRREARGAGADASIEAFDDTWTWGDSAEQALLDIAAGTNRPLQVMMEAMCSAIGPRAPGPLAWGESGEIRCPTPTTSA
jgi:hypothetical protein